MKLYVVVIEDRHADVECEVFTSPDSAITFARKVAKDIATSYGDHPENEPEERQVDGWLYAASCSPEDDHVHVVEKEADAER